MKWIKKIVGVLVVLFCCGNLSVVYADEAVLSELSEEECVKFIAMNGVDIPKTFREYDGLGEFVKGIIVLVEKEPNVNLHYNLSVTREFANSIKDVVNEYYGVRDEVKEPLVNSRASLLYSTVISSWSESFMSYYCYAYAISSGANKADPGYFSGIDIAESFSTMTVADVASVVCFDLRYLGYAETTYSYDFQPYNPDYVVIALKKNSADYHFMRMINSGTWYHKPGSSAILKYNYPSPALGVWTNERSVRNIVCPHTYTYDSDVVYIRYKL